MMGSALLIVGWLATASFVATGVLGYVSAGERAGSLHVLLGLVACLLLLFSHTWIMFYLIGTGKAIKLAVAEHGLPDEWIERTKEFKNRSYPALTLAMLLVMATFILGGGVERRVLPAWIHHSLFYLALAAQLRSLWIEHAVLSANRRLMNEAESRLS